MDASINRTPGIEEIYDRYANLLFRLAFSLLLSKEDAEDAVQEVFIKFVVKKPAFNDVEHEKAWFVRVTINLCHDLQRRRKIRSYTPLEEISEIPHGEEKSYSMLEDVFELSEKYKTVILLHYFEDFSVEEIADILKISKSAVKMRLKRGRDLLKGKLEKEYEYV